MTAESPVRTIEQRVRIAATPATVWSFSGRPRTHV